MQTFRKIAGFLITNFIVIALLVLTLAQPSAMKLLMKEAKAGNYDTLIVGQSHGSSGYDPYVISEQTGDCVINLSRRLYPVVNLKYIIEEVTSSESQYKRVILDVDPTYWVQDNPGNFGMDTNLFFRLTGSRWIDYVENVLLKNNYNEAFADYDLNAGTIKKIPQNLKAKCSREYLMSEESAMPIVMDAVLNGGNYKYIGRGFSYGLKKSGVEWASFTFNEGSMNEENLEAFREIVEYCDNNGIELICVQSALSPHRLQTENMDDVHDYFTSLCTTYNVPFYDLNYVKAEYLSRTDDDYVDFDGHMMGKLADRQSEVLGQILMSDDKDLFFYDTYEEVLSHLE